jgi:hypothetical protein
MNEISDGYPTYDDPLFKSPRGIACLNIAEEVVGSLDPATPRAEYDEVFKRAEHSYISEGFCLDEEVDVPLLMTFSVRAVDAVRRIRRGVEALTVADFEEGNNR